MEVQIKRKWNDHRRSFDILPCNDYAKMFLRPGRKTLDYGDLDKMRDLGICIYDCDDEIKKL